ncbi:hypothetical protein CRI94_09765 [Longibacter salinarum]|uniref:Fibronectin type-III domain-containing protein n=1 Tax=Longibacter salinarum TaxID=1850348 RepID=A0A2A8CYA6_9BACT|nr:hypothetical protein [Longibacter salinarum]PEN13584.1 hypothetical protein CRI94_09765 [Longibacter salinarum]
MTLSASKPDGSSTTTRADVPEPETPVAGTEVNAHTSEFTWTAVSDATEYELQIAPTADFAEPFFDSSVGDTTTISVYDAIPENGSTCYWRVRAITDAGAGDWSGVANFVAARDTVVEQRTESTPQANTINSPAPTHPTKNAPVDGHAATFEWTTLPQMSRYEVEVAESDDFDTIIATVPVRSSNMLTLYAMLPEDGTPFAWRVRGVRQDGSLTDWSGPASFVAATDQDVIDYKAEEKRKAEARKEAEAMEKASTATERAEASAPVLTAQTSGTFAYTVAYLMILTFVATVYLISTAV